MGRATTLLVRHRPGARTLRLTVKRLLHAPSLYPMSLEVTLPSANDTSQLTTVLFDHPRERQEISLPIPSDIEAGAALDVVIVAERATKSPRILAPQSLYVESIEQLD